MGAGRTGAECVGAGCRAGLLVGVVAVSLERVLSAVVSETEKEAEDADAEADAEV